LFRGKSKKEKKTKYKSSTQRREDSTKNAKKIKTKKQNQEKPFAAVRYEILLGVFVWPRCHPAPECRPDCILTGMFSEDLWQNERGSH
jgi:hypothetical protein